MTSTFFSTAVLVTHWLIVSGLFLRIIMRRPPVGVSVAWVAVIASTPFVGATLYLLFGERRLGRQRAARIALSIGAVEQWLKTLRERDHLIIARIDAVTQPVHRHAERVMGFPALDGNTIELFDRFQTVFDALVADIDAAKHRCHLCFYIWHAGGRTEDVVEALVRAAARGVECLALADAIGSKGFLRSELAERLRRAGVEVTAALPTGPLRNFFVRRDLRNHRKIVVIDEHLAYTGSQNLVDPRFFKQNSGVGEWIDAIVRITGPAAAALDGVFSLDWAVETGRGWERPHTTAVVAGAAEGSLVQIVPSGPDLRPQAIHQLLLTAIYAARRDLVMTTPYFVPDEAMLTALTSAAQRGVAVTLIVPARNDSWLVRHASAASFDDLLAAGARIALFQAGLLHTKSLTIDGTMSIFGSVNLDMRSLWLNFEISLFVYDSDFTGRLKALQSRYLDKSEWLDAQAWLGRPRSQRIMENAVRLAGPLL